ncbi:splicing factor 3a, subunit 1 [Chytriomyces hyalinus]|nr:splicing factor 3a, subunit 1 [Chytriomyces hyalinus]
MEQDQVEIIPPPGIREIADKTAQFIAKSANGLQFEGRLRESNRADPKFAFLNPADPYHRYYKNRVVEFSSVQQPAQSQGTTAQNSSASKPTAPSSAAAATAAAAPVDETPKLVAPPPYDFCHDTPSISPQDLAVLKLTAQFAARNGRSFVTQLASRESRNAQFDFLRQNHSLYPYFSALVTQYTKVLMPVKSQTALLSEYTRSKKPLLEAAQKRAEYKAHMTSQQKAAEAAAEQEKREFASIDWHDFVVVDTVEFLEGDADNDEIEFALPVSVEELKSMSLVDKKRAVESATAVRDSKAAPPQPSSTMGRPPPPPDNDDEMDVDMEEDDDEDVEPKSSAPASANIPRLLPNSNAPIKIRANYAPKVGKSSSANEPTQLCPRCGQAVKVSEMAEHMRIELLDPKWREQKLAAEAKKRDSNLAAASVDVARNLTRLSDYRTDIFGSGEETHVGRKLGEEETAAAKEKIVWDGHSTSIGATTQKVQMQAMDAQLENLMNPQPVAQDVSKVGPQLPSAPGTLAPPPGLNMRPPTLPMMPTMPMARPPPPMPMMPPPPQRPMMPAFGLPPAPPGLAYPGAAPPLPPAPVGPAAPPPPPSHPRDDDELPDGKRSKTGGEADSNLIPAAEFIASNPLPITLSIITPTGGIPLTLTDLAIESSVGDLKERISEKLANMPVGKQKLANGAGVFLKNSESLGYYNMKSGETLVLKVQTRGGRK